MLICSFYFKQFTSPKTGIYGAQGKTTCAVAHELRTSDVHGAYKDWCMQNNFGAENIKNFNQALRSFAQVVRKRPKAGGGATTMLLGYRIIGRAEPLQ